MSIESDIFKRCTPDYKKLIKYGFLKQKTKFIYETFFLDNNFKAIIQIDKNGIVSGKVYDILNDDEFLLLRIKNQESAFTGKVKNSYEEILNDIKIKCFSENLFINAQANRIHTLIYKNFKEKPVFPWEKESGYGVYKNPKNNKWYALIMNIDLYKIDKTQNGETEIVNIKLEKEEIQNLLKHKGFFPAWHMNKKNWISIILNDTLKDEKIMELITKSRNFTLAKNKR